MSIGIFSCYQEVKEIHDHAHRRSLRAISGVVHWLLGVDMMCSLFIRYVHCILAANMVTDHSNLTAYSLCIVIGLLASTLLGAVNTSWDCEYNKCHKYCYYGASSPCMEIAKNRDFVSYQKKVQFQICWRMLVVNNLMPMRKRHFVIQQQIA